MNDEHTRQWNVRRVNRIDRTKRQTNNARSLSSKRNEFSINRLIRAGKPA